MNYSFDFSLELEVLFSTFFFTLDLPLHFFFNLDLPLLFVAAMASFSAIVNSTGIQSVFNSTGITTRMMYVLSHTKKVNSSINEGVVLED